MIYANILWVLLNLAGETARRKQQDEVARQAGREGAVDTPILHNVCAGEIKKKKGS
ncbi:hypothetical protein [Zobellella denitrificans]|uniref:hypothetical protein n=1 Tax=Zobellella denitrificans TaxID=347534 RepID=UPI0015951FCE|nr:hypothetical protein [Zobellella denitrificans]